MNPTVQSLLQGRPYRNSVETDVRETWKSFGWTPKAKFSAVGCSQCGQMFGPGDSGFSHCRDHAGMRPAEE